MTTVKFNTNIKCSGCVAAIKPHLDKVVGEEHWKVDLTATPKLLTVEADQVNPDAVIAAVEQAGYKAEKQ